MSTPLIHGIRNRPQAEILGDLGTALLQIKNARGLTLNDMAYALGRSDDQVSKYIAGEAEMGVIVWMRTLEAWPEIEDRLTESASERRARAQQRPLDLDTPVRRDRAA
jgi:transcriptional regulator with XRE-family HTH domain